MFIKSLVMLNQCTHDLRVILEENKICLSHGIDHAIKVCDHARNALKYIDRLLSDTEYDAVSLAALLHDADDPKLFPEHKNYENLRYVLRNSDKSFVDLVIKMVELVSASKNGDSIPNDVVGKEWMLIPRYADRLEAIGLIGIERCWTYNKGIGAPLFLTDTMRASDEKDLWENIASKKRYESYTGKSVSMIDHFYDKLLHLAVFPIKNKYFDEICAESQKPLVKFVLEFGHIGRIDNTFVENFIKQYKI
jgi:uncharacterized protein